MAVVSLGISDLDDSNVYLVTGSRNVLIDTGLARNPQELTAKIRSSLRGLPLDMLVLTHCHADHVGGLKAVVEEFGCNAYAHQEDAVHLRRGDSSFILDTVFGFRLGGYDVQDISDGEIIDLGEHRLRVIHTPGHTRGSICLYDEVSHALISGDTLFVGAIGRTDLPGGSFSDMVSSLRSLRRFDIKGLYPGHGMHVEQNGRDYLDEELSMFGGVNNEDFEV
ncbi:MAG: MBL fold metallo-hydrolase [Candidatus Methanomethylophilaceae archaeon]|nr:MBL fold metallo-hydrolase [Candidatus Methanomethylophilaceae archaeon]